ncbi:eukaryotic translation initiation factor 2B subunit gamma [Arctopsyche grandis]|uniref:eukaryotic translation initiation factor 2B subunit gamma n=1 Tax=Arctopsyche grandis TaxID=121162 RepID=UPI00406D6D69
MKVNPELQAVLLCGGPGSRLPELKGAPPKCLLPVGPYPLIWYPLNMLQKQGFQEVIVIVLDSKKTEIIAAIDKCNFKLSIQYVSIPEDEDLGTADSLRLVREYIITDVLVISCDFIADVDLSGMIDLFRRHDASAVALMFDNGPQEFIQCPGPSSKVKPERDLVGIDKETQRLVFFASASDFEEEMKLPRALLKKHPVLSMHSKFLDAHVYIFKKWVLDFLDAKKHFSTIKGELLPFIVKKQLSKPTPNHSDEERLSKKVIDEADIFNFICQDPLDEKIRKFSFYNDHSHGMKGCYNNDVIRCYAYVAEKSSYAIRVNTLPTYCLINSKIMKIWDDIAKDSPLVKIHVNSDVKSKQVDDLTIIGEQSNISEKTSFTSSIVGSNCMVENKIRVINTIIMNNVTLKEGCVLQDCIIYSGATVQEGCSLKLCIVGPDYVIPKGTNGSQQMYSKDEDMITVG